MGYITLFRVINHKTNDDNLIIYGDEPFMKIQIGDIVKIKDGTHCAMGKSWNGVVEYTNGSHALVSGISFNIESLIKID